jgi:predicted transcriptional regulator
MKPRRGFAWRSKVFAKAARISFVTEELLLRVRTSRRWELIRAMVGQGPMSLEVAARFVGMMGRPFTVTFRHFSMLAFWTKTTARKSSFRTMPSIWNVAGG